MSTTGVPKLRKFHSRFQDGGSTLSISADWDEIGGLLSRSDSLECVLLRQLCFELVLNENNIVMVSGTNDPEG